MKRFKYAFEGLYALFKKDHKFLIHVLIALIVVICGFIFQLSAIEWILIIIAIGLVGAFEAMNTALEYVVDLVTSDYHALAKRAKDVAAASVLIAALIAFVIGLIIFIPHIF
ncbi:diacylglycerol kinase family protein [Staphylococcus auricularis]|uniref:diacylglycerol kinase family protein n=1 Tax=Staphylococcus auricularis TaxID=29379 RepID=UPI003EC0C3FC